MLRRVALALHGVPFVVQHAVQTEPECVSISTHIVRVVAAKMLMAFELFKLQVVWLVTTTVVVISIISYVWKEVGSINIRWQSEVLLDG